MSPGCGQNGVDGLSHQKVLHIGVAYQYRQNGVNVLDKPYTPPPYSKHVP